MDDKSWQVDAGADFVITQFFYDTEAFLSYVKRCREVGITCPIIPGIMAIQVRAWRLVFDCLIHDLQYDPAVKKYFAKTHRLRFLRKIEKHLYMAQR